MGTTVEEIIEYLKKEKEIHSFAKDFEYDRSKDLYSDNLELRRAYREGFRDGIDLETYNFSTQLLHSIEEDDI